MDVAISAELVTAIRALAPASEKMGQMHPEQLEMVYQNGWFNLFVPKEYGGLELDLPEALRIEESLALADGSTGWTVTLCSGANWFIGFLQPELSKHIFEDRGVCFAGSGCPSGTASSVFSGYEISGYWKYATGAPHATIFTANCLIEKNGKILEDENGKPLVRSFWFTKEEVVLHKTWNCIGMVATASEAFSVSHLTVSEDRSFNIDHTNPVLDHPVYRFPFLQFAEATLAVNSSGMAARFLDLCEEIFVKKKITGRHPEAFIDSISAKLSEAQHELDASRQLFYTAVEHSWNQLLQLSAIETEKLSKVSETSRRLALVSRRVVDELFPYCGIAAADPSTEINRVWRNIHTASQHGLLNG